MVKYFLHISLSTLIEKPLCFVLVVVLLFTICHVLPLHRDLALEIALYMLEIVI